MCRWIACWDSSYHTANLYVENHRAYLVDENFQKKKSFVWHFRFQKNFSFDFYAMQYGRAFEAFKLGEQKRNIGRSRTGEGWENWKQLFVWKLLKVLTIRTLEQFPLKSVSVSWGSFCVLHSQFVIRTSCMCACACAGVRACVSMSAVLLHFQCALCMRCTMHDAVFINGR